MTEFTGKASETRAESPGSYSCLISSFFLFHYLSYVFCYKRQMNWFSCIKWKLLMTWREITQRRVNCYYTTLYFLNSKQQCNLAMTYIYQGTWAFKRTKKNDLKKYPTQLNTFLPWTNIFVIIWEKTSRKCWWESFLIKQWEKTGPMLNGRARKSS